MLRVIAPLFLLPLSCSVASAEVASPAGYVVAQSASPVAGWQVEILLDERFNDSVRDQWAGADQAYLCRGQLSSEMAALCASLAERPAVPPWVRLLGEKGELLDQRKFERELASVESVGTVAEGLVLLGVTVDFGVGFGSYAGFSTYFVVVRDDRFDWGRAASPPGQPKELVLSRTLKSDWRAVPRSDGRGQDLLAVRCRLSAGTGATEFEVLFERYRFDGTEWHRAERREPGFWESEEEFPAVTRFPGES